MNFKRVLILPILALGGTPESVPEILDGPVDQVQTVNGELELKNIQIGVRASLGEIGQVVTVYHGRSGANDVFFNQLKKGLDPDVFSPQTLAANIFFIEGAYRMDSENGERFWYVSPDIYSGDSTSASRFPFVINAVKERNESLNRVAVPSGQVVGRVALGYSQGGAMAAGQACVDSTTQAIVVSATPWFDETCTSGEDRALYLCVGSKDNQWVKLADVKRSVHQAVQIGYRRVIVNGEAVDGEDDPKLLTAIEKDPGGHLINDERFNCIEAALLATKLSQP